jgi:hypothetical protein
MFFIYFSLLCCFPESSGNRLLDMLIRPGGYELGRLVAPILTAARHFDGHMFDYTVDSSQSGYDRHPCYALRSAIGLYLDSNVSLQGNRTLSPVDESNSTNIANFALPELPLFANLDSWPSWSNSEAARLVRCASMLRRAPRNPDFVFKQNNGKAANDVTANEEKCEKRSSTYKSVFRQLERSLTSSSRLVGAADTAAKEVLVFRTHIPGFSQEPTSSSIRGSSDRRPTLVNSCFDEGIFPEKRSEGFEHLEFHGVRKTNVRRPHPKQVRSLRG